MLSPPPLAKNNKQPYTKETIKVIYLKRELGEKPKLSQQL